MPDPPLGGCGMRYALMTVRTAPPHHADTRPIRRIAPTGPALAEVRRGKRSPRLPPEQGCCVRAFLLGRCKRQSGWSNHTPAAVPFPPRPAWTSASSIAAGSRSGRTGREALAVRASAPSHRRRISCQRFWPPPRRRISGSLSTPGCRAGRGAPSPAPAPSPASWRKSGAGRAARTGMGPRSAEAPAMPRPAAPSPFPAARDPALAAAAANRSMFGARRCGGAGYRLSMSARFSRQRSAS
jgi:hypothetical protein